MIHIRVLQSVVTLHTDLNTADITNPDPSNPHIYLFEGSLNDIARYAGSTVDWIMKVAHSICDPSAAGRIYKHREGTASYWYDKERDASWRRVAQNDLLSAGIYESTYAMVVHVLCYPTISIRSSHLTSSRND